VNPLPTRNQSAVLIPVPEAEPVVERWRLAHDPAAHSGSPAHITLLVPWLPPERLDEPTLAALDDLFADVVPFDFELTGVRWFGSEVLWLSPEPAAPFAALTHRVAERFGTPPWDGEFPEVVPHLTVGKSEGGNDLSRAAADIAARLPVSCRAEQVWVMIGDGTCWSVRHRLRLPAGAR
jgi:2'-5' RNA ligase